MDTKRDIMGTHPQMIFLPIPRYKPNMTLVGEWVGMIDDLKCFGISMTTLANLHHEKCDVPIDRTTIFGNPYDYLKLGITRSECIRRYKVWFYNRLKDESFRDKVLELKGKRLGCWCVPDLCHGHVILEYLEGIPLVFPNDTEEKSKFFED